MTILIREKVSTQTLTKHPQESRTCRDWDLDVTSKDSYFRWLARGTISVQNRCDLPHHAMQRGGFAKGRKLTATSAGVLFCGWSLRKRPTAREKEQGLLINSAIAPVRKAFGIYQTWCRFGKNQCTLRQHNMKHGGSDWKQKTRSRILKNSPP